MGTRRFIFRRFENLHHAGDSIGGNRIKVLPGPYANRHRRPHQENLYAIIVVAERFNHDLTLAFGMLSYECDDEAMFIRKSEELARQMLKYDENHIDDLFFGNPRLARTLSRLSKKS